MHTVNPIIATTSSNDAAAKTSDGIPLATPYPRFCNFNMPTTTTAGDTAARMKPRDNPRNGGMSKISIEERPQASASISPGRHVSLIIVDADVCDFCIDFRSSSRPDRKRIVARPEARMNSLPFSGKFNDVLVLALVRRIPDINIPRRGGRPIS